MLITSHYPNVSLNTANPATEMARRDNQRRDLFEPVQEAAKNSAEKPIASDDKAKQQQPPASNNLQRNEQADTETGAAVRGREQDAERDQESRSKDEQQRQQERAEQQELRELQARDREVRAHEQAHAAVGGQYASAPTYTYERGPDGNQYAVGGEVQIDLSEIPGDPQATVQKMQQVRAAALAPVEPSAADRRIAADASRRMLAARAEMAKEAISRSNEPSTPRRAMADTSAEEQIRVPAANTAAASDKETLQRRNDVIAGFYQQATRPSLTSLRQQV
ncbi:putative metalloprotease CJM1_0395 family protein [Alkalimonas sp. MEB108]|uniref:Metalloprotease CJM1_0395 family protein n=1 Tax=Alkalimonas cellulosilytica TaxID=3058395 RepID=A0ABU7J8L7_9GAMM|nr:putative metalloprotease CJM1_0395 family protein [Alkalimonas sp. MEB108]MEE2002225.1 putative metalloprotease CJM1_0395 family protein [Alkalimonas sp. MEB108]